MESISCYIHDHELIETDYYENDLVDYFGVDAVRYYVLTAMPQDNDGLISWESVIETINSDLANVYGNLVSRTIAMTNKITVATAILSTAA